MALASILAGPIIRRADENQVCVWIATAFDPTAGVEVKIFKEALVTASGFIEVPTSSVRKTIRAGENVFVTLVTAYPAQTQGSTKFPKDSLLAYELWFTRGAPPALELKKLVKSYDELTYTGLDRPTFYLQGETNLLLAHGSCRKPDGIGNDALAAADTLIGQTPRELSKRPCMLCMTGDQIYANSVDPETLKQIHLRLIALFGYDEQIPIASGMTSLKSLADVTRKSKRLDLAKDAGLSDDKWHLFGMSEFVTMYLLSFHNTLWEGFNPAKKLDVVMSPIADFITALPAVMRAFANAPVYMIFDDHEVTDDWNLYKEWKEKVQQSDLGRRVVTNALVAYWLCQAWGNDPSRFDANFEKTVQDYCDLMRTSNGKVTASTARPFEDFFWQFDNWVFVTPTTPPVFFLDTRTRRELFPRGRAPQLLSAAAWQSFIKESNVKNSPGFGSKTATVTLRRGDPLIIVAPTPVFGMLFTEAKDKLDCLKKGPEDPDFEHWRFNQRWHHEFLKGLIARFAPRYCVFLSGDVHTAFTAEAHYILQAGSVDADGAKGPPKDELDHATRFYQFTSSPLKNEKHNFGAQIDDVKWPAGYLLSLVYGIDMWETWDLVGYDKLARTRVINELSASFASDKLPLGMAHTLYVFFMDGQAPDDPFVTMSSLVAENLQRLSLGRPLWRETGSYFRHIKKNSNDAPFYPYNNIGLVRITRTEITHELCSSAGTAKLMPKILRYPYKSTLPS